jgi:hypothetical protein
MKAVVHDLCGRLTSCASNLSDPLETSLKRKVCKGLMKLAKARAAIRLFKNTQG